jgi:hypothetical protein
VLSREATNTSFIVFGMHWPRLEHGIYWSRGDYANHYRTDAVLLIVVRGNNLSEVTIFQSRIVLYCPIMCLYVLSSVQWCSLQFPHKHDVRFVFIFSCLHDDPWLIYVICVRLRIVVSNTYCVVVFFVLFVFVLSLVYPMFTVSLACPFLIAPSVFLTFIFLKNIYSFSFS